MPGAKPPESPRPYPRADAGRCGRCSTTQAGARRSGRRSSRSAGSWRQPRGVASLHCSDLCLATPLLVASTLLHLLATVHELTRHEAPAAVEAEWVVIGRQRCRIPKRGRSCRVRFVSLPYSSPLLRPLGEHPRAEGLCISVGGPASRKERHRILPLVLLGAPGAGARVPTPSTPSVVGSNQDLVMLRIR